MVMQKSCNLIGASICVQPSGTNLLIGGTGMYKGRKGLISTACIIITDFE